MLLRTLGQCKNADPIQFMAGDSLTGQRDGVGAVR